MRRTSSGARRSLGAAPPSRPLAREMLCTLGPASMNDRVLARLTELGATLFRINLSHTKLADVARVIDFIQARTEVPVCLDTEGAQVRTGTLVDGTVEVRENALIEVCLERVPSDAQRLNLYPAAIVDALEVGDFISIDFNAVLAQVTRRTPGVALLRVLNGGRIGSNKAVTVERPLAMPPLTDKDKAALVIGRAKGIRHVALSFANCGADVDELRAIAGERVFVISKIECRAGVAALEEIAAKSDALLIDRGDLSREFPAERIPALQKEIVRRGKAAGRKVYVATNLLESMVSAPMPTRAELNDVHNTLLDGVDGLVLAAETAIGKHPIACASMIVKMIRASEDAGAHQALDATSLLVEPHGGTLVNREAPDDDDARAPRVTVPDTVLMDCEQIALGTYSPLQGFMDSETLESVLDRHRLPDGTVWSLPITLQIGRGALGPVAPGARIALQSAKGTVHALLDVGEIYPVDFARRAKRWYGTDSLEHPGVARLAGDDQVFVAGAVTLVRRLPSPYRHFELTPFQTRFVFARKGWNKVVGFHTRNVVHRVHEHIQLEALERTGADGLYISPIVGPRKAGDFLPEPILKSYQMMLDFRLYPPGMVVLGSFATYPRYAGPREAVFTALCRKNMGCSHFIIGRDHTGVGDFYAPDANRALFERLGDIGVEPVFFEAIGYDTETGRYRAAGAGAPPSTISGSQVREALKQGRPLPDWFMREMIQDSLRADLAAGRPLFSE